jgi:hypothetical protein
VPGQVGPRSRTRGRAAQARGQTPSPTRARREVGDDQRPPLAAAEARVGRHWADGRAGPRSGGGKMGLEACWARSRGSANGLRCTGLKQRTGQKWVGERRAKGDGFSI